MSMASLALAMALSFPHLSSAAGATPHLLLLLSRSAVEAKAISRWWAFGPAFPATVHEISIATIASATKAMLFK